MPGTLIKFHSYRVPSAIQRFGFLGVDYEGLERVGVNTFGFQITGFTSGG